jgi:hypothetical protein
MTIEAKKTAQPKWYTDMQGSGLASGKAAQEGVVARVEASVEERLAAVEQLLEDHGIFPREQK